MVIAVDAMGGDNAPSEIVKGAVDALENGKINIVLVGKENLISSELKKYSFDENRLSIVNAESVIGNDETPTTAVKQKKDSSMITGLRLLRDKSASAFVSAGNTGALLTGATVVVGRLQGLKRPALATLLPNAKGFSFLIDSGANVDVKPEYLVQFAKMGAVYMENVMGIQNPRIGLLNIGAEKEKGNALTKEAYTLLEESDIHFYGNVEARDVPQGVVDVVVCDAFVGNIVLKYTEGLAGSLMGMIKEELMSSTLSKIGALMAKDAFKNLKKRFDYTEVGGAPFLGLKALVVKAHGSSNAKAIKGAINQCIAFIETDMIAKMEERL